MDRRTEKALFCDKGNEPQQPASKVSSPGDLKISLSQQLCPPSQNQQEAVLYSAPNEKHSENG